VVCIVVIVFLVVIWARGSRGSLWLIFVIESDPTFSHQFRRS
jgi:hypothetical protein